MSGRLSRESHSLPHQRVTCTRVKPVIERRLPAGTIPPLQIMVWSSGRLQSGCTNTPTQRKVQILPGNSPRAWGRGARARRGWCGQSRPAHPPPVRHPAGAGTASRSRTDQRLKDPDSAPSQPNHRPPTAHPPYGLCQHLACFPEATHTIEPIRNQPREIGRGRRRGRRRGDTIIRPRPCSPTPRSPAGTCLPPDR
jgi:hypothetical protein